MEKVTEGLIFNIKRFSVHDGPGIRTSIFLKGCPLECIWCHNPEGISQDISIWHNTNLCIGCGRCVDACPEHALAAGSGNGNHILADNDKCSLRGRCVDVCPTGAISFTGKRSNVEELMTEIRKDNVFYQVSGGGVTITGGEPAWQPGFCCEILKACKEEGINTAIETCLFCDREVLELLADHVDLFITDLKIYDSIKHEKFTSKPNSIILENFAYLAGRGKNMLVRLPLIPGITDSKDNIRDIEEFVRMTRSDIPIEYINFNPLTKSKYQKLSIPFSLK